MGCNEEVPFFAPRPYGARVLDSFVPRSNCARCERPTSVCICAHMSRLSSRTKVLFVQHPREERKAIGTAKLTHMCLPNSELVIGVEVDDEPRVRACLSDTENPAILLYPGDSAAPLESFVSGPPRTLVVLDGTWPQSKKLLRMNPGLAALPRVAFSPSSPSEYRIRREPKGNYVSTVESVAHALGVLENDAPKFAALYAPFRAMVDAQIAHEREGSNPRKKKPRTKSREERLFPEVLAAAAEGRIVCVVGEANAWPYKTRKATPHYPDELVQLVALRVPSGESLDVVVRPLHPLAPSTSSHTQLSAEQLLGGTAIDEAVTKAQAFLRPDDLVVTWGHYTTNLFARSGVKIPNEIFCLRAAAKRFVNGKVGTPEDFLLRRGPAESDPPAHGRGRAGKRVGAIARALAWILRTPFPVEPSEEDS